MRFKLIPSFGLTAFAFLALLSSAAQAGAPSKWCELVLTQEAFNAYSKYVEEAVAQRTQPMREGKAELHSENGPRIDVLEGINRELAKPILEQSRSQNSEFFKEVAEKWLKASREEIKGRYATLKERKEKIEYDADGLPLVAVVQNNRELALKIVAASKSKMGASDIETEVVSTLIEQARDKHVGEAATAADGVIEAQTEALAASLNRVSPNWDAVRQATNPIFSQYIARLNEVAPLRNTLSRVPLARAWVDAIAKGWSGGVGNFVNNKTNADARRESLKNVELDADGLPKVAFVQNNRDAALKIMNGGKKKLDPADLVGQLQMQLGRAEIAAAAAEFTKRVNAMAEQLEAAGSWAEAKALLEPLMTQMSDYIRGSPALAGVAPNKITSTYDEFVQAKTLSASELPPVPKARLNDNGVPEVVINQIGVRAYYDTELGTVVLESSAGMFAKENGMMVALDHGDGTTLSNASSWKYILPKLIAGNLNVAAINLPMAGIGMPIKGLHGTIEYSDRRFKIMRARADNAGKSFLPLVHIGRSMGAQKGLAHALLREGEGNLVDMYVLMSISNPHTIAEQIVLVNEQVANGTIKGVVKDMLDNAAEISAELRNVIALIKKKDPKSLETMGEGVLALQGRGDRDGGVTVMDDLVKLRDDMAPMMLIYEFNDPLAQYKVPGIEKMSDENLEAQHNLFSNYPNMTPAEAQRLFPMVSAADRPMIADQHFEAVGAIYGMGDFIAETRSPNPAMQRRAAKFRAYRKQVTGSEDRKLLDWYRESSKIAKEDFENAVAGRASRAARLKRVQEFFENTQRKHSEIYSRQN